VEVVTFRKTYCGGRGAGYPYGSRWARGCGKNLAGAWIPPAIARPHSSLVDRTSARIARRIASESVGQRSMTSATSSSAAADESCCPALTLAVAPFATSFAVRGAALD
jgi:hypothetical protein